LKRKFLFILFFILCLGVNVHAGNSNLLQNSGFESISDTKASDWSTYIWEEKNGQFDIASDELIKHSGQRSMKINSTYLTDIRLKQEVDVKPNSFYKLAAWVKTQDIGQENKGANISADGILSTSKDLRGNNDWQQIELYGKTGKDQKKLIVTMGLGGYGSLNSGTLWLDDVSVEAIKSIPAGIQAVSLLKPTESASNTTQSKNHTSAIISLTALLLSIAIAYFGGKRLMARPSIAVSSKSISSTYEEQRIDKKDIKIMLVVSLVYLLIALINLGSLNIPQTSYTPKSSADTVEVDFGEKMDLGRVYYYCGLGDGNFNIEVADDNGNFNKIATVEKKDIFSLKYSSLSYSTNKIRFVPTSTGFTLNELYFIENGKTVPIKVLSVKASDLEANKLFDEQKTFTYKPSYMANMYFDEIYHARTAFEHIHNLEPYEWTHPPLGKLLMAIGILVFGMNPFGFRIVGMLFGVAMLPLMYLLGKKIFNDWRFATATSLLMMFDFMHFTQTRIATIDVYGTFFIIAMYYFMYDTFMIKSYELPLRLSIKPLFLSGLMFGIGVASKWIVAYGGAGLALLFFLTKCLEYRDYRKITQNPKLQKPEWLHGFMKKQIFIPMFLCVIFFIIIPVVIYYLSYIPYMEVPGAKKGIDLVINYQKQMFDYHSKLKATHSFSSPWYEWPIIYKPTWFYSGSDVSAGNVSTIVTMGNPAIWWVGILAFFTAIYIAFKKKDKKMILVFTAIVFQYMPWVLVPRITWIYHYFSTVPFVIICIVYVMKELYERNTITKKTIYSYLIICAVLFVWFYPALSGLEVPKAYINNLRWLNSWIF